MNVIIINIGDELLIGQVLNTNASWMAAFLNENGIKVLSVETISDNKVEITNRLSESLNIADAVIMTGGLGPTKDDVTKHTLCDFFHSELELHAPSLKNIIRIFEKRGYNLSETNRKQAEIPTCCEPLLNQWGTAPGMWFSYGKKVVVSLPGVPHEMKGLMQKEVIPKLKKTFQSDSIFHQSVWTFGIGESFLSDIIEEWEVNLPQNIHLAYLPEDGMVRLRLSAYGNNQKKLEHNVSKEIEKLKQIIGEYIFGYGNDTLENIIGKLLTEKKKTLSTVESCTGGFLAHKITSVAGASLYYKGGVVTYANEIKEKIVHVKHETLQKKGAVSEQTAKEMAIGCRQQFNSDYAIATTGIAGPNRGSIEKPVGTVWIALANKEHVEARQFTYGDDRLQNISRTANQALRWLQQIIEKE